MFEDALVESARRIEAKKGSTVFISAAVHAVMIALLILVPLVFTERLEGAKLTSFLLAPPPPPTAPSPTRAAVAARPAVAKPAAVDPAALIAPPQVPEDILYVVDLIPDDVNGVGVPGGVPFGASNGSVRLNLLPSLVAVPTVAGPPPLPPPPPPPPPPTVVHHDPIRIGGGVQAGNVIFSPSPAYPAIARTARVAGTVILSATIAEDGSIKDLKIISSSSPLLNSGVVDTVRTWKYKPTLLNGEPVEVLTTITVNFSLGR